LSPFSAERAGPDGLRAGQGPSAAASAARGQRSQRANRDAEAEPDTDRRSLSTKSLALSGAAAA